MISLVPEPKYPEGTLKWIYLDMDPVCEWHGDLTDYGYDYFEVDDPGIPDQTYSPTKTSKINDDRGQRIEVLVSPAEGPQDREGLEEYLRNQAENLIGVTFVSLTEV